MSYRIKKLAKINIKNPVMVEGLPGIGNVGKVVVDFMIDNLKAKKLYDICSDRFPHAVFVNEKNLVELPHISVYHKKIRDKDVLLVAGDIQPIDEASCYDFCRRLLDIFQEYDGKEIITLGGIGLQTMPQKPKVYCTANSKKIIQRYKAYNVYPQLYGIVGPIIGVSGLLVGLSKERKIQSIALLAETFGHPTYLGIRGAREILRILKKRLGFDIDLSQLDEEIKDMEGEFETKAQQKQSIIKKRQFVRYSDTNYIG